MSATATKVALVTNQTALTASCPTSDPTVVDFVGYGTTAYCFEGSAPAAAPSNTTTDLRKANGCTDTNYNSADFATATPVPRNTSTALNVCRSSPALSPIEDLLVWQDGFFVFVFGGG